jgi:hypothetical protein
MKKTVLLKFLLVLLCVSGCSNRSPEGTLEEFYNYNEPGNESLDPLILAGKKVVPLVIEKVKNKNMPRRRLAIEFLGNGSYEQALPVLKQIMTDDSEEAHFRAAALIAVFQIDEESGKRFAQENRYKADDLGEVARDILESKEYLKSRRTYFDALIGRHD